MNSDLVTAQFVVPTCVATWPRDHRHRAAVSLGYATLSVVSPRRQKPWGIASDSRKSLHCECHDSARLWLTPSLRPPASFLKFGATAPRGYKLSATLAPLGCYEARAPALTVHCSVLIWNFPQIHSRRRRESPRRGQPSPGPLSPF
jgi:hypothetical protein